MHTETMLRGLLLLSGLALLGVVAAAGVVQHWSFDPTSAADGPAAPDNAPPRPQAAGDTGAAATAMRVVATSGMPITGNGAGLEGTPAPSIGQSAFRAAQPTPETITLQDATNRAAGKAPNRAPQDRVTAPTGSRSLNAIPGTVLAPQDTVLTRISAPPQAAPAAAPGNPQGPAPVAGTSPTPASASNRPEASGLPADAGSRQPAVDPALNEGPDDARAADAAPESTADDAQEELAAEDVTPWPDSNCPERLPAGSTRASAELMTRTYGCQYLQYCQAVNDGSGDTRCWWGAWRLSGG